MDLSQMFLYMENVHYQEQELNIAPVENDLFSESFFYQQQGLFFSFPHFSQFVSNSIFISLPDMQLSPATDYSSSSNSTPSPSNSLFLDNSPSQAVFDDFEHNQEFFDNIFKADISNEQMNTMLQEIEFDDQLLDFDAITSDYSEYSTSAPTSANSTPKRKYSSSSSCYSYDLSDCSSPPTKKQRKPRKTMPDRKERKKEQNKKAAIKYREKKKNQQQQCTDDVSGLESKHSSLMSELATLQNELKVILPLASAAFNCNAYKKQQLELLLERINPLLS